jgi:hypothetical protein
MTTKGLVMLFHGASGEMRLQLVTASTFQLVSISGTGKTMMVNALATKLKKR